MNKIQIHLKNFFINVQKNKLSFFISKNSYTENERPSKTQINFFLNRTIPVQQSRLKQSDPTAYKSPLMEAIADFNLKNLSKKFDERNFVITLYIMTQNYKSEKTNEINEKYEQYVKILQENLKKISKPNSLFTILFVLDSYNISVSKELHLALLKYTIDFFKKNYNFTDEGKLFSSLIVLYAKLEHKIILEKREIEEISDLFYKNWRLFSTDHLITNLNILISSRFALELTENLTKGLEILEAISPYVTFSDYELILSLLRKLFKILEEGKNEKIEENKVRIVNLCKNISLKTFEKSIKVSNFNDKRLQIPKTYFFINKSIILKVFVQIKELEALLKSNEISTEYLNAFSKRIICFDGKEVSNELLAYYEKFCWTSLFKDDVLKLISFITFDEKMK